jgi:hypothetical protein
MKKIGTHRISKHLHGTFAEFFGSTAYITLGCENRVYKAVRSERGIL